MSVKKVNPIAPGAEHGDTAPDVRWKDVKPEDLNQFQILGAEVFRSLPLSDEESGVARAASPQKHVPRKEKRRSNTTTILDNEDRELDEYKDGLSRFLKGKANKFVHIRIRLVSEKHNVPDAARPKRQTNAHVVVTPAQRAKFTSTLRTNIKDTQRFFFEELLPITESLTTAVRDAEERFTLLTDAKAGLPLPYIVRKGSEAAAMRIHRHIADLFDLTSRERRLLNAGLRRSE